MDSEEDRGKQHAQGEAKDAAIPGLIGLTKGGETDPQEQDEDDESAEIETEAPHGMVPELFKRDPLKTILAEFESWVIPSNKTC